MPTIGGGDDFVWIGGPDQGLWLLVVVGDEAIDGGLEIDDAFEDAALETPLGEDGEETLDGVEPTGRGGREMEAPARMDAPAIRSPWGTCEWRSCRGWRGPSCRLQALAISRAQIDGDASTHPADSHDAKAMVIPTRTLTSASIH